MGGERPQKTKERKQLPVADSFIYLEDAAPQPISLVCSTKASLDDIITFANFDFDQLTVFYRTL
jgi:hypothetical protein